MKKERWKVGGGKREPFPNRMPSREGRKMDDLQILVHLRYGVDIEDCMMMMVVYNREEINLGGKKQEPFSKGNAIHGRKKDKLR